MTPQEALQNVREAHRLIYAYQQRIIDFVFKLRKGLNISDAKPSVGGLKHFSEELHDMKTKPEGADYNKWSFSAVYKDSWTWDFLLTYAYQYYLGEVRNLYKSRNDKTRVALIQISDDAVYASEVGYCDARKVVIDNGHMMLDITKHTNAKDSHSVFVLACEYAGDGEYSGLWNTEDARLSDFLKSAETYEITVDAKDNAFLLYRFDMAEVFTPEGMEHVISVLHKIVCELAPLGWPVDKMPQI